MAEHIRADDDGKDGFKKYVTEIDSMLRKCKEIALNKAYHVALINDKVMCAFLVYCLGEKTENRILSALNSLHLLLLNLDNRAGLSEIPMLLDALEITAKNKGLSPAVREYATVVAQQASEVIKKTQEKSGTFAGLGKAPRESRFYIPLCSLEQVRSKITKALICVPGIISITYDLAKHLCIVRANAETQFKKEIANLGFDCYFLTKDQHKKIVLLKLIPDVKTDTVSKAPTLPDYPAFSDDEDVVSNTARFTTKENHNTTGWFAAAKTFMQRSFYW